MLISNKHLVEQCTLAVSPRQQHTSQLCPYEAALPLRSPSGMSFISRHCLSRQRRRSFPAGSSSIHSST